jgi:uncharacterized protein YoxC
MDPVSDKVGVDLNRENDMSETATWVLVGLAAVLVAAAVVALVQLARTLKTLQHTLESTGSRVDKALDDLSTTLNRVNRVAGELERGTLQISALFDVLGGVGDALVKIRSSIGTVATVTAALGPMLVAAARGWFRWGGDADEDETPEAPEKAAARAEVER